MACLMGDDIMVVEILLFGKCWRYVDGECGLFDGDWDLLMTGIC